MLNDIIEKEVMKAAIADIDVKALAKKFKPQIEKVLNKKIEQAINRIDIDYYVVQRIADTYIDQVVVPGIKGTLGIKDKPKKKRAKK